ncbi:MAG TPA: hypothetical protein DDW76_12745 [Cyanobacteria bacterium UBA11369]|nr:hypothetical protein [Cyanobacteria bacterium UBA11368]HBE49633.1 hypothetical protein [Cyanobacteria bacterium UBA11369]
MSEEFVLNERALFARTRSKRTEQVHNLRFGMGVTIYRVGLYPRIRDLSPTSIVDRSQSTTWGRPIGLLVLQIRKNT